MKKNVLIPTDFLWQMSPESQEEIHFPVAPVRQQGIVEIKFEISSQAGRRTLVHCVEVLVKTSSEK